MDLTDVGRALRRFWLLAITVFALTVALGYFLGSRGSERYEATASIAVAPDPAAPGSAAVVDYYIPLIVEKIGTTSFRQELGELLPAATLAGVDLTASNDIDTGIVRITATGPNRAVVTEAANAAVLKIIAEYSPGDTSAGTGGLVVEVLDSAPPGRVAGDNKLVPIMLASVVLGAILAVGAAVVAQWSSRSFDVTTRIRNEVGVPVLAQVPSLSELRADSVDLGALIAAGSPLSDEAFQGLRTRIEVQLDESGSALAVTSWDRNEGRTTITAALALLLVSVGREVVAIDGDLREPQLHERLGEPFAAGLAEFDQIGRDQIVAPTRYPQLGLVSAGVAKDHPAQILTIALPATLDALASRNPRPVIIVDAPPLRPARKGDQWLQLPAETATVLRAVRRVLLVIDAKARHLPELATAVERLRDDGVVVVGAVLNRRRRRWLKHR